MKTGFIIAVLLGLLHFGCINTTAETSPDTNVYSFLIDELAYALPPPPPPEEGDTISVMNQDLWDSIKRIKVKVAIVPELSIINSSPLSNTPSEYRLIFNDAHNVKKSFDVNALTSSIGHEIVLADTSKIRESIEFQDFDLLFEFSNIFYNEDQTKALLEVAVSSSRLSGTSAIYGLVKKGNEWEIDYERSYLTW